MALAVLFIFFVARGCVATQEATQVRKYVMGSNSLLTDSSNLGREKLQPVLRKAGGDPEKLDQEALNQVVDEAQLLHKRAIENDEVPLEFEEANNYLITTLGIRASATERVQRAAESDPKSFGETLTAVVGDYRTSDNVARSYYFPASGRALDEAGQQRDRNYLKEPQTFMDYGALGMEADAAGSEARGDPNVLHGVEIAAVEVAGQQLLEGGTVFISGAQEPIFTVTVTNSGEVAETRVPVEVVMMTQVERQANSQKIERIKPYGAAATVEIGGFRPGELNETVKVTVEVGPVQYEELVDNNTLTGWVTFGM